MVKYAPPELNLPGAKMANLDNMKKLILLLFLSQALVAQTLFAQDAAKPKAPPSERHEFVLPNFKTESGATLPKAVIVYGTYGHLNTGKDNVVLVPSHYLADYHGYEWLIGSDLALDPSKLFIVATELFGSGHSSSPSNTPEPYHGPRFPVATIRDNVEAVHRLLTDDLLLARTTTRGILAYPGPARIKLFPQIACKFLGAGSSGVPMNPDTQKLIIPLDDNWVSAAAAPLAAIYVLAPPDEVAGRDIRIVSISQREAFVMLLGSAFNCVISDPDRLRRQFEATQALANATIVRKLCYPRSLESLPLVREAILADLCAHKSEIATCKG